MATSNTGTPVKYCRYPTPPCNTAKNKNASNAFCMSRPAPSRRNMRPSTSASATVTSTEPPWIRATCEMEKSNRGDDSSPA